MTADLAWHPLADANRLRCFYALVAPRYAFSRKTFDMLHRAYPPRIPLRITPRMPRAYILRGFGRAVRCGCVVHSLQGLGRECVRQGTPLRTPPPYRFLRARLPSLGVFYENLNELLPEPYARQGGGMSAKGGAACATRGAGSVGKLSPCEMSTKCPRTPQY